MLWRQRKRASMKRVSSDQIKKTGEGEGAADLLKKEKGEAQRGHPKTYLSINAKRVSVIAKAKSTD